MYYSTLATLYARKAGEKLSIGNYNNEKNEFALWFQFKIAQFYALQTKIFLIGSVMKLFKFADLKIAIVQFNNFCTFLFETV